MFVHFLVDTNIEGTNTLFKQDVVKWEELAVKWYNGGAEREKNTETRYGEKIKVAKMD